MRQDNSDQTNILFLKMCTYIYWILETILYDNYYCEPGICAALLEQQCVAQYAKIGSRCQQILWTSSCREGKWTRRRGSIVCRKWRDKKNVFTLSTMHVAVMERIQARFENKQKPRAIIDYIQNMAGVDQSDQLIGYFPMHRKTMKWRKKTFFHLLTLCTIQTMILLNKHRKRRHLKRLSLETVIKSLLLDLPPTEPVPPSLPNFPASDWQTDTSRQTFHWQRMWQNLGKTRHVCYVKMKKRGAPAQNS